MKSYKLASDVIEKNQSAIVVFTRGENFYFDSLGNGITGKWVVDPDTLEEVDTVIIYLQRPDKGGNRLYMGNYSGYQLTDIQGRKEIRFTNLKEVGTTDSKWSDFAHSGQNPVSYVSK